MSAGMHLDRSELGPARGAGAGRGSGEDPDLRADPAACGHGEYGVEREQTALTAGGEPGGGGGVEVDLEVDPAPAWDGDGRGERRLDVRVASAAQDELRRS